MGTTNKRRDTGGNGKKRGIRGSRSLPVNDRIGLQLNVTNGNDDRRQSFLSVAAKRSSRWLLNLQSRKTAKADQDVRSQSLPALPASWSSSSSSSSLASSIKISQAREELEDLLEKYSEAHNVSLAQLDSGETAKKSQNLFTRERVKWRSTRFFSAGS